MKIETFSDENDWLDARKGKVTGTKLYDCTPKRGGKRRTGFYDMIAERVAIPHEYNGDPRDYGTTMEQEALDTFSQQLDIELNTDLVLWVSDEDERIALSPDAFTEDNKVAVEMKCPSEDKYFVEAFLTQEFPSTYKNAYTAQATQYFIVNEDLETLYFAFYSPRMPRPLFYLTIDREDVEEDIEGYLEAIADAFDEMEEAEKKLTF